ncbi:MAG TPA: hypothetical protein VML91_00900 [Burkholderiales bacterium]|nr:hypothetical protein [Burkholderiales bacterium]
MKEVIVRTGHDARLETVPAAKLPIPHAVAATARLGTAGARAFTFDTLRDEGKDRPARVVWKFRDGTEMSATGERARGGADQPFDEAALLARLADNAAATSPALPDALARAIRGEQAARAGRWETFLKGML